MLMDEYQRDLVDPTQYHTPVDARQVLAEVKAGYAGRVDHESYGAMLRAIDELGISKDGKLTIARVADAKRSMDAAIAAPHDRAYDEWAVITNCGNWVLLRYLMTRADAIAKGIQPGATMMLSAAFGL
jgi:hypothetical protein